MPTQQPSNLDYATIDMLELSASQHAHGPSDTPGPVVELVSSSPVTLTSTTTTLLHGRLRAVAILLLMVYGIVFVWTLVSQGADAVGTMQIYRNVSVVRLIFLAGVLAVLFGRQEFSLSLLRGVEYTLFAVLTVLWALSRYETIMLLAEAGNIAELQLDGA